MSRLFIAGCAPTLTHPGFDLINIPRHTSAIQIEPAGKFAAAFHLVDGRIRERYDLSQLGTRYEPQAKFSG